jgi:hypothetical protein
MKKSLLKPPQNDGQILLIPQLEELIPQLKDTTKIGIAHQPYFFNPGVALKFLFLDNLDTGDKEVVFVDSDRIRLEVDVPSEEGYTSRVEFINTEEILYSYPAPSKRSILDFFKLLKQTVKKNLPTYSSQILQNIERFKEIFISNLKERYLKDILCRSFLRFYRLKGDYLFISDIAKTAEFKDFFEWIFREDRVFREIFNNVLDEYRQEFRFRYKNYPFPKLEDGELPFWVIEGGKRRRCFKKEINLSELKKITVFPRAATLTLFLRLYKFDLFIHGVGGANYEWVCNRIIERFFKKKPPLYIVISGTFLIANLSQRELPYFFFKPERVKEKMRIFIDRIVT